MDYRGLCFHVKQPPRRNMTVGWTEIGVRLTLFLVISLTSVFFFACDLFYSQELENKEKSEGMKSMEMLATTREKTTTIPPIDIAAPLHTATASFALG